MSDNCSVGRIPQNELKRITIEEYKEKQYELAAQLLNLLETFSNAVENSNIESISHSYFTDIVTQVENSLIDFKDLTVEE